MDFVRLGPAYSTVYEPDLLIEGYNSLIWTERHQEPGEFELKSFDVDRLSKLLPEDTLVSHLETLEVMQVETQSIEMVGEGVDAVPEITIKGSSATIILNHRWVESPYQTKRKMRRTYSATGAACVLLYQAVDNNSGYDVTRGDTTATTPEQNNYGWNTLDDIPNVIVTENVAVEGAARGWWLEQGMLLPQLTAIISAQALGIRCLRPVLPNSKTVITVDSALATRGIVRRTVTANVAALCFEIYDGVDRSGQVQFSLLQGHILAPQYLTSNKDLKTHVEMMSGVIEVSDVYRPGESGFSGWKRKTMAHDAGTPEIPTAPTRPSPLKGSATKAQKTAYAKAMDKWIDDNEAWTNKRNAIVADFRSDQSAAALALLNNQRKVNMFAGDISDLSPYKYKIDYDLGDTVMLYGDYGKSSKMIVNEYVRTEDTKGDRGFPGLVAP